MKRVVVAKDGSGDCKKISRALEVCRGRGIRSIYIKNGRYREKVLIDIEDLEVTGESAAGTIIEYDDYAWKLDRDGRKYGTFRSQTVKVVSGGVRMRNLSIKNTAGQGDRVGQAVALLALGDRFFMEGCTLDAYQDTLMTGPLPGDLKGTGKDLKYSGYIRQYYRECRIEGNIDFIFGGAHAVFERCRIICKELPQEKTGYVSAPSTEKGQIRGHVFLGCTLEGGAGKFFLGRPWREYGKCSYIGCNLGECVAEAGWSVWRDTDRHKNSEFIEAGNYGSGSNLRERPLWVKVGGRSNIRREMAKEMELLGVERWRKKGAKS